MCRDFALSRLALMLGLAIPIVPIGMLPKGAIAVQPAMAPNAVAQTADRQKAEADRLYSQGVELQDQRQHQAALEKLQQALAIYQKTGDLAPRVAGLRKISLRYCCRENEREIMTIQQFRYGKEEFAQRGKEIYESQIRSQVEEGNYGKIVAIDIETGAFELANDTMTASDRLLERYPDAQIWCLRIGHKGVHRFGLRHLL